MFSSNDLTVEKNLRYQEVWEEDSNAREVYNISLIMRITVGFELMINGLNIISVISNTLFKNNRGLGFWFNSAIKWLLLPRAINLFVMSLYFFSFIGDICFCDGRHYFFDHCEFTDRLSYKCEKNKKDLPSTPDEVDKRLIQCISFFNYDDIRERESP